jgi:hypothetical protein
MEFLMEVCRHHAIEEILDMPDVRERVVRYFEQNQLFKDMLLRYTRVDGNVIITDLRGVDPIYSGNRFLIYSLFPEQNISIWMVDGRNKTELSYSCGTQHH